MKWMGWSWRELCETPREHVDVAIDLYNAEQAEYEKMRNK